MKQNQSHEKEDGNGKNKLRRGEETHEIKKIMITSKIKTKDLHKDKENREAYEVSNIKI